MLDPQHLLVSEDPRLLSKHRFLVDSDARRLPLFPDSELVPSSAAPGSYLSGGFASFEKVVRKLSRAGRPVERHAANPATEPSPGPASPEVADGASAISPADTVFRATGRLVEVYATVKDDRGHYVDDLPGGEFTITEDGQPLQTVAFESRIAAVSVALLFDTTGSMQAALPALRNAALKLIGDLRPIDSVAVYSFNDSVTELQPFTTDKSAAKRAVMRTHALGSTALYDALVRVNLDIAGRTGKKVIVVFTDGSDNCSVLTTDAAILRAKSAGVPIYTIAQGSALGHPELLKQLSGVSKTTGGVAFAIHGPGEIREVFEAVSQDLMHGYLITFQPPPAEGHTWHAIDVVLRGMKGRKVRAREGYYPD
jgi:Ca-activated chloride channel family protein